MSSSEPPRKTTRLSNAGRGRQGFSSLTWAAYCHPVSSNDFSRVDHVINMGVDVDEQDPSGFTALQHVIITENVSLLAHLVVERKADISSAMIFSATQGKQNSMMTLKNAGVSTTAMDAATGQTPLHAAAANGHKHVVLYLCDLAVCEVIDLQEDTISSIETRPDLSVYDKKVERYVEIASFLMNQWYRRLYPCACPVSPITFGEDSRSPRYYYLGLRRRSSLRYI